MRNGGTAPPILLSAEDGEYSAARFGRFTLKERTLDTNMIGGWLNHLAGLDFVLYR
jgi:hypothetical protein